MEFTNLSLYNEDANSTSPTCPDSRDSIVIKGLKIFGYCLILGLSFFGNILVIWAVRRSPQMRTVTNHFIVNVSLADLLTTIFNMVPTLFWIIQGVDVWYVGGHFGEALCKLLQFFQLISISCSVLSMAAIAFDRVFAIFRPLKRTITFPRAKGIIAGIWVVSFLISSPNLYILRLETFNGEVYCVEKWSPLFDGETSPLGYTIALFICFYALPLLIIAVLYSTVVVKLWNRTTPGQTSITNRTNRERTNRKVLKMLITVVVVFALCWLPLYVRMFLMFTYPLKYLCGMPYHLDFITLYLGHANSSVNPYIYVIFNENFRKGFKSVVKKRRETSEKIDSSKMGTANIRSEKSTLLKRLKINKSSSASHSVRKSLFNPAEAVLTGKDDIQVMEDSASCSRV